VFQIEAARKKAEKDEAALQNKLKFELESQETPEQRRARERAQVEDADLELSNELFQGGGGKAKSASSARGGVWGLLYTRGASLGWVCARGFFLQLKNLSHHTPGL
jgi:hypothetical protein